MKKIAILTMGVKLKGEKGYTRFGYLADFLVKAGYQVDLIRQPSSIGKKHSVIWRQLQKI